MIGKIAQTDWNRSELNDSCCCCATVCHHRCHRSSHLGNVSWRKFYCLKSITINQQVGPFCPWILKAATPHTKFSVHEMKSKSFGCPFGAHSQFKPILSLFASFANFTSVRLCYVLMVNRFEARFDFENAFYVPVALGNVISLSFQNISK